MSLKKIPLGKSCPLLGQSEHLICVQSVASSYSYSNSYSYSC